MAKHRNDLPQLRGETFITDGGVETHMIFNEGVDAPHQCVFTMIDSDGGRDKLREYYRRYLPLAQRAGTGFLFDTNTWRASADWGALVGYDATRLRQNNIDARPGEGFAGMVRLILPNNLEIASKNELNNRFTFCQSAVIKRSISSS